MLLLSDLRVDVQDLRGPAASGTRFARYLTHPAVLLEDRDRRVRQITCAVIRYIGPDFPRGPDGAPTDRQVETILDGKAA